MQTCIRLVKKYESILNEFMVPTAKQRIINAWSERHRVYHDDGHLADVISEIEKNRKKLQNLEFAALILAAFYHDIYYKVGDKENEEKSVAAFVEDWNNMTFPGMMFEIKEMIMATKYRKRPLPFKKLQRIMWDADNAGFTKGLDVLKYNEAKLQKEFIPVFGKNKYKKGQIAFLKTNFGLFGERVDKDLKNLIKHIKETL